MHSSHDKQVTKMKRLLKWFIVYYLSVGSFFYFITPTSSMFSHTFTIAGMIGAVYIQKENDPESEAIPGHFEQERDEHTQPSEENEPMDKQDDKTDEPSNRDKESTEELNLRYRGSDIE